MVGVKDKSERQLIEEIGSLRKEVAELGKLESAHRRAEENLSESEAKYKNLFESAIEGIYTLDRIGRFSSGNKTAEELCGYERGEMIGKHFINLLPKREIPRMLNTFQKVLRGKPTTFEVEIKSKSGDLVPLEIATTVLRQDGKIMGIRGMVTDITERKKAREALQESEKKYRELVEGMSEGLAVMDENRIITLVNSKLCQILEYKLEEIVGKHAFGFFDSENLKVLKRELAKRVESRSSQYEISWTTKSGRQVPTFMSAVPIFDAEGIYRGSYATVLDFTERKQAEEALQESEEFLRALFDNVLDGILILDYSRKVLNASPNLAKMFGVESVGGAMGRDVLEFVIPEFHDRLIKDLANVKAGQGGYLSAYKGKSISGREFWVEGLGTDIILKGKHVDLVAIRDITERKRAQEQLKRSFVDLAETISRAMGARDPYTPGHQQRVAELARLVGEKMGLDRNRLMGLYIGGLLHDIGKISTPEVILSKPGELTEEEWNLIRVHTKQGYKILKDTNFPWPIADMALHHHERLDGSGYPHGISDDRLSLEVRILAVCDVVEAMSSHHPYRPAKSKEEVLAEIKSGRETKYDAEVVDVMLQIIENGEFEFGWQVETQAATKVPLM